MGLRKPQNPNRRQAIKAIGSAAIASWFSAPNPEDMFAGRRQRISLNRASILIDPGEPSYLQFAAADLADYMKEITGEPVSVRGPAGASTGSAIVVGQRMAHRRIPVLWRTLSAGDESFLIDCSERLDQVVVTGSNPRGTNLGLASLMKMIRTDGNSAYLEGPFHIRRKPSFPVRGIHLNGWPFNSPYSFRDWSEQDWQRYIDMAWVQGANLILLLSFIEIMPVPLSPEDAASLQEFRRVVEYAQRQRGMEVWVMHAANRVAVSDCGVRDPKQRPYWMNQCQVDLDPADPRQFQRIVASFEALYRIVNNADGFVMIDSDPGGWPQSPLREQVKIFNAARNLLNRYNQHGREAKLVDWMWLGWGRHKHFDATHTVVSSYDWGPQNPDASDVAFMEKTIRAFKAGLPEPWSLIAGFPAYLRSSQEEGVLSKTIFLPYGAIEYEPSAPSTNVSLAPIRSAFEAVAPYPGVQGVMGNAQTPLLQLPRTYDFLATACNLEYRNRSDREVLFELANHLYPEQSDLIVEAYLALEETDAQKIETVLDHLRKALREGRMGRPGVLGRKLFPDRQEVAKNLVSQLKVRAARQALLTALHANAGKGSCQELVEDYLEAVLSWNQETGWQRMIKIGIWTHPIYQDDATFRASMSALKRAIGNGAPVTSYAQINSFFTAIGNTLLQKYDPEVVMETCIEPMKLAVIQAP